MTDKLVVGEKLRAYCSECDGDRNCEIKGHHPERGEDAGGYIYWAVDWLILACCGCDHVFAQTISSNSEDIHYYHDDDGSEAPEYVETILTWPARSKRSIPTWFERRTIETDLLDTDALDASLLELYGALDKDLMVLASIGIRTSFDIASELLGVSPDLTFARKLDALVDANHITLADREHVETLVNAGSAAAHRGWRPSFRDLNTLMTTLENFIYSTMVLPAKHRAQAAEIAKVKLRVPARGDK